MPPTRNGAPAMIPPIITAIDTGQLAALKENALQLAPVSRSVYGFSIGLTSATMCCLTMPGLLKCKPTNTKNSDTINKSNMIIRMAHVHLKIGKKCENSANLDSQRGVIALIPINNAFGPTMKYTNPGFSGYQKDHLPC